MLIVLIKKRVLKKISSSKPLTPTVDNEGQIVVISILLVGVLLSIILTLSLIFTPKIRASSEIKKSSAALYAAESSLEWCLYVGRKSPPQPTPSPPIMSNGASYVNGFTGNPLSASDCLAAAIRARGTYQGISRTFEISF
jgi:hypothetical protein